MKMMNNEYKNNSVINDDSRINFTYPDSSIVSAQIWATPGIVHEDSMFARWGPDLYE